PTYLTDETLVESIQIGDVLRCEDFYDLHAIHSVSKLLAVSLVIVDQDIMRCVVFLISFFFFFQAEDGIRDRNVTGVQTCALPISLPVRVGRALDCDQPTRTRSVLPPSRLDRLRDRSNLRQTHDSAPRGLPRVRSRARHGRVVRPRLTRTIRTADARTRSGAVFAIQIGRAS